MLICMCDDPTSTAFENVKQNRLGLPVGTLHQHENVLEPLVTISHKCWNLFRIVETRRDFYNQ